MREIVAVVCLALFALTTPAEAAGQAVYGNIVGTVVDESGAGLPNAKVTITDTNRAVSFTTTTNDSGFFTQRFLIVGPVSGTRGGGGLSRLRAGSQRVGRPGNQPERQAAARRAERDGRGQRGDSPAEDGAQRRGHHLHGKDGREPADSEPALHGVRAADPGSAGIRRRRRQRAKIPRDPTASSSTARALPGRRTCSTAPTITMRCWG